MSKLQTLKSIVKTARINTGSTIPQRERLRGRKGVSARVRILDRDKYKCRSCGRVTTELEVDHIVPLHLGGGDNDENKQVLCLSCHEVKTTGEAADRGQGGSLKI